MSNQPITENPILLRTSPGALVPNSLPPDALFILNLGPYINDGTQSLEGANESRRARQLYILAQKIEEIASILEEVRNEQIVGTDPEPDDEESKVAVWEYINGVIRGLFDEISREVEGLQTLVNRSCE
jgi:hypothetical protein